MSSRRRNVIESSESRAQLLDTAEQIMREEGYPAVTTRRLASRLGVSNQLVHYYFRTMDDLFVSLLRRNAERNAARLIQAITSDNPVRGLMKFYGDKNVARMQVEYLALINHRKEISREATRHSEHMRSLESEALARLLSDSDLDLAKYPAIGLAVILSAVVRILSIEESVGISLGHAEARAIVDRVIQTIERGEPRKAKRAPRKSTRATRKGDASRKKAQ